MKRSLPVLLIALAALVAKVYCALKTIGTSDVILFYDFARAIHEHGLLETYRAMAGFNHTPLIGWFAEAVYAISGGQRSLFAVFLRLPAIVADFLSVISLLWFQAKVGRPHSWALCLYAASPVGFMVSGYHGNVDSILALAVMLAAIACAMDQPAMCGVFMGIACNIKVVPLVLLPVFALVWWSRKKAVPFTVATTVIILAGWSYPLLTMPTMFIRHVLGYGSFWGVWGIPYLLRLTGLPGFGEITMSAETVPQAVVTNALKILIVSLVLFVAWRRRGMELTEIFRTLAVAWALFFVFAPGFAAQYLAWIIPIFLLADEGWFTWVLATSSVALFVFYNSISGGMPWRQGFTVHSIASQWTWAFVLPWLTLVAFLCDLRLWKAPLISNPHLIPMRKSDRSVPNG